MYSSQYQGRSFLIQIILWILENVHLRFVIFWDAVANAKKTVLFGDNFFLFPFVSWWNGVWKRYTFWNQTLSLFLVAFTNFNHLQHFARHSISMQNNMRHNKKVCVKIEKTTIANWYYLNRKNAENCFW